MRAWGVRQRGWAGATAATAGGGGHETLRRRRDDQNAEQALRSRRLSQVRAFSVALAGALLLQCPRARRARWCEPRSPQRARRHSFDGGWLPLDPFETRDARTTQETRRRTADDARRGIDVDTAAAHLAHELAAREHDGAVERDMVLELGDLQPLAALAALGEAAGARVLAVEAQLLLHDVRAVAAPRARDDVEELAPLLREARAAQLDLRVRDGRGRAAAEQRCIPNESRGGAARAARAGDSGACERRSSVPPPHDDDSIARRLRRAMMTTTTRRHNDASRPSRR